MNNLENTQLGDNPKYYIEVTAQDRNRAAQVYNEEAQLQLYIDKEASHRYVSDDLNMMITFLQRLADGHVELSDSNVGEHMDDMEADFELEEKKGRDMDDDSDIDSDDYLLTRDQAIKNAMKGKKIKKSQLKELVKRAISEQPMGATGGQVKGAVQLPKATNPADIKKLTDKGVDVKLAELELKHFDYTDEEGRMAKSDLLKIAKYASRLFNMLQDETQLEGWIQAKITKASDYISSVFHYLEGEEVLGEVSPEYKPNRPAPKVGDLVGNTVQGFVFRVLSIEGDKMKVEDEKTGIKFMTNTDNMYPHSINEALSDPEITTLGLQNHLINLHKELEYYLHKGETGLKAKINNPLARRPFEADLRYAEMLKKDIADARAELDRRIKSKKGTNESKEINGIPGTVTIGGGKSGILIPTNQGDYIYYVTDDEYNTFINAGGNAQKLMATIFLKSGKAKPYKPKYNPMASLGGGKGYHIDEDKFRREQGLEETYDGMYFVRVSPETFKRAVDLVNRNYPKANITIEGPDTFRTKDIQTAEDLIMDFGVNDIELVQDNLNDFGDSQEMFDDIENYQENPGVYENKSTCCMRCGRKHVKGTSCPKPYLSKSNPRHCKNRK